jgi:hypothetical protein
VGGRGAHLRTSAVSRDGHTAPELQRYSEITQGGQDEPHHYHNEPHESFFDFSLMRLKSCNERQKKTPGKEQRQEESDLI